MRTLAAVVLAAAIAGCGGQSESDRLAQQDHDARAANAKATKALGRAERRTASVGRRAAADARTACSVTPRKQFAHDFGMRSTRPEDLAARYARGYQVSIRADVEAACLRGILSRK